MLMPPQSSEEVGKEYFTKLCDLITQLDGRFVQDESGYWLVVKGKKISLTDTPENLPLADLMLHACDVGTQSPAARAAIQRLRVKASHEAGR
jgi:hypothetical protein